MAQRLIETDFPLRIVSEESVREKNIRHGHISTLHIWWARKPLAASRTTALSALLPDDPARREALLQLLKQIAPWEAVQTENPGRFAPLTTSLEKARARIREAFAGRAPRVLDPFAGGGAIPLEALRLGCETYALDYNPVAVLINRCVLEYPQRFRRADRVPLPSGEPHKVLRTLWGPPEGPESPLLLAVRAWGQWVLEEARAELERFYPPDPDGAIPVGYYWMRTVPCQNPSCGVEIPLTANWWLAKKDNKKVALRLVPNRAAKRLDAEIVGQGGERIPFDPAEGTVSRAYVRCPLCGGTIDDKTTRRLFREGQAGQRLMAVVLHHPGRTGKAYRLPTARDLEAYRAAEEALEAKRQRLWEEWGMDPVPDEPAPGTIASNAVGFRYCFDVFGDYFNARQKLALITFAEQVRRAHAELQSQGADPDGFATLTTGFAKAVTTYLALAVDKIATYLCALTRWRSDVLSFERAFDRQALPMVWDYGEVNPFSEARGGWDVDGIIEVLSHLTHIPPADVPPQVVQGSATQLPWPDNFFDAVLTDPPYYDNVNYSALSDFFYCWLKRTVGDLYPELFATPLTPKSQEIVADPNRQGGREQSKRFFEQMLTQAFREIYRVLKPEGIAVIVFAHKTTAAWETVINALLEAGLYMTASWPIHTEMQARLNAQETASLASSIYMVCRKRTTDEIGDYATVRREIEARVRGKLAQFWEEGIRGADFFMSAIGPAVEAFGRYARVEKLSGERVTVGELLGHVQRVVAEFALERVLQSPDLGGVDAETRFYLLWRWTYNHARVPFDEASKLARAVGAEITELWSKSGFVQKDKEVVRALGPKDRARDSRFLERERHATLVDALHKACLLWENNERQALAEHLARNRGTDETFWRVAQAIAEVLPAGDKEKQLVQGLLAARRGAGAHPAQQGTLWDES